MSERRGFTLVELLIALVLVGIVSTALHQLLVNNQRVYRQQTQRVEVNSNARAAMALLPNDVRELDAGDPAGSDVVGMTASSFTYKAMRGLYVLCQPPNTGALQVTVSRALAFGLRPLDASQDSILILAENNPDTRSDDAWLHADVTSVTTGTACPGGAASLQLQLAGVTGAELGGVFDGSVLRSFEVVRVSHYPDASGVYWMGGSTYRKASGTWSATEHIVGPLSAAGMQLAYYDTAGNVTADPTAVARVGIGVESRSSLAVRAAGGTDHLLQDLMTHVALRNNPGY